MGATKVNGTFRSACEAVMETLRAHSGALTDLLHLVLEDSSVDWTMERDAAMAQKVCSFVLFSFRLLFPYLLCKSPRWPCSCDS